MQTPPTRETSNDEPLTIDHHRTIAQMKKRPLLIAFHFPPQSESSGIQRTLSFAKNLGEFNWEPMVLTAHASAYERKNASQLDSIPADLPVYRPLALDSKRHLGLFGRYPEFIALPDRWITWWLFAVPTGLWMIARRRPDVIWSTFPIATAHLIALTLARLSGLPWVADFRDPMLQVDHPKSPMQRRFFGWIERHAIARCDSAVFTTQGALESYSSRFPSVPTGKFHVIENGYDEESFALPVLPELTPAAAAPMPMPMPLQPDGAPTVRRITLVHSGVLYQAGRDPTAFLQAIGSLKQQGEIDAGNFKVILRAAGTAHYFTALIASCDVADLVTVEPPVAYCDALAEMMAADGLLIFQGTPFNTQIPAKIYEYFRARKPVLGLLDPDGETAKVLRAAGFHDLAPMTSPQAIAITLAGFIRQIREGRAHVANEALIDASSRKHRARQLAQVFDRVTARVKEEH